MAEGRIYGTTIGSYGVWIYWSSAPDIETNSSSIGIDVYITYNAMKIKARTGVTNIDGNIVKYDTPALDVSGDSPRRVFSRRYTVKHDENGERKVWIAATFPFNIDSWKYGWVGELSAGATVELDHIPRASVVASITPSVVVNGRNAVEVQMTRYLESYWHIATFAFGNNTHQSQPFETGCAFIVPTGWLSSIPTVMESTATVTVVTYTSEECTEVMGEPVTAEFVIRVPEDAGPTASKPFVRATPYNDGTPAANISAIVQGYSRVKFIPNWLGVFGQYGATIAQIIVECDGVKLDADPYIMPTAMTVSGVHTARCTAVDTRGLKLTMEFTFDVFPYASPALTEISLYRSDASGNEADAGGYIYARAKLVFSDVGGLNSCEMTVGYALTGGGTVINTALISETPVVIGAGSIQSTRSYVATITAMDALGNTVSYSEIIATADATLNALEGGNGAAFGKYAEKADTLDVAWNINSEKNITADGDIEANGNVRGKNIFSMLDVYPVGSIYLSVTEVSPETLFGGTWERIMDTFLLAAGEAFEAGSTGGEAEHTLTVDELPVHKHEFLRPQWYSGDDISGSNQYAAYGTTSSTVHTSKGETDDAGGDRSHNNMPPYLAVYMWKRTA